MTPQAALTALGAELASFLALLEQESAVLNSGRADDLEPLVAARRLANRRLADFWQVLATSLALPADAGIELVGRHCAGLSHWRDTEHLVRRVVSLNQLNSKLIDEQLHRTQAAVQVLRSAAGSRALYGSDGRISEFLNTNRDIDTA